MHMTIDEFLCEFRSKLAQQSVDEIAKEPGHIHTALSLSAMMQVTFSEKQQEVIIRVIQLQSCEMGLALYEGGQWSRQEAVEVAKCWIEHFHNTNASAYLIADTDAQKTTALLEHAHKTASNLISGRCFSDPVQAGQVSRACDWLRENRTDVTGKRPPSNAPDGIHAGIELLRRKLFGEPDVGKQDEQNKDKPHANPKKKSWLKPAQEAVGRLWVSFRDNGGTRERDCFEANKGTARLPECIKGFDDFQKCKEAAEKHSLIPRLRPKRGRNKGKPCL
jgi:hypothetical protein